jgi:hypothetical protein
MPLRLSVLVVCLCAPAAYSQQQQKTDLERAVEEFQSQTRNLGLRADSPRQAQRNGHGQQWHGRIFENFRNDALDAIPHEIRQRGGNKSLLRRNQFGFNVAGPVIVPHLLKPSNNTYFSVSYEGVRESISRTYLRTIPTMPERTGDYSAVVDQAGNLLPIYDPATTRPNPNYDRSQPVSTENLQYLRDPFPGQRIPADRLDPVSQQALTYYPAPNTAVGPFFRNNYFINAPETNKANGMIAKLDQSLRDRHRVSVEIAFSNGFLCSARWFPNGANPGSTDRRFRARRGSVEHVFTVSPQTINTLSFEASSDTSESGDTQDQTDYGAILGLGETGAGSFPLFSLDSYLSMGQSYPRSRNARNVFTWSDSLSFRHAKHTMRLIGQYRRQQVNTFWPQYPAGSFRFSAGLTSLPGIVNTGHAFASFVLGQADYAERSIVTAPSYFRQTRTVLGFRDRYEMRRGLSVNFGLDLDRSTPRTEKYDRQSTIDLNALNPANGRLGALTAAGEQGQGRAFQPDRLRLEPSISVAWNPRGDSKTVVRVAYSLSYSAIPIYTGQWGTQGFSAYPTWISPNVQLQPALILVDGMPPLDAPIPDLRPEAANNTVADLIDATSRQPAYQSASLTLEREMPWSLVVSGGVSYSGGKNLLTSNGAADPNAIRLDFLSFRDLLNDEEFNRSLRPYPQYKGFDVYSSYPIGRYQRDVGYLRLEKRASQGLSLSASYEFAKQWDDYSGPYQKQDFWNAQNEWSLTPGTYPQRLSVAYAYELPFGSNKPLFNFPDWRKFLTDGWSISGAAALYSGPPLYLRPQFNNTGGVVKGLRVNTVPGVDPHAADPGPELWFNPAAFDQPPDFSLGDASRTHSTLRNPGEQNYDLTVNKRVTVAGRLYPGGPVKIGATFDGVEERSTHFKTMMHRIHTGKREGAASLEAIAPYALYFSKAYFFDRGGFPNDLRNCTLCHEGKSYLLESVPADASPTRANEDTTIRHPTPIGTGANAHPADEPAMLPLKAACTGCHATGGTFAHVAAKTVGGVETCGQCHVKGAVGVEVAHGLAPASGGGANAKFSSIVSTILEPRCASTACHAAGATPPRLDATGAYGAIVGVPSGQSALLVVKANEPAASYLVHKLRGTAASVGGSVATLMPTDGALAPADIAAIEAWIANGAPND